MLETGAGDAESCEEGCEEGYEEAYNRVNQDEKG
jgi:hypothetical protein